MFIPPPPLGLARLPSGPFWPRLRGSSLISSEPGSEDLRPLPYTNLPSPSPTLQPQGPWEQIPGMLVAGGPTKEVSPREGSCNQEGLRKHLLLQPRLIIGRQGEEKGHQTPAA